MTPKKPHPMPPTVSGRLGGLASKRNLSRQERQVIARDAAIARWQQVPAKVRSEAARKAVKARWAKAKKP